jgi:hypothetical protein
LVGVIRPNLRLLEYSAPNCYELRIGNTRPVEIGKFGSKRGKRTNIAIQIKQMEGGNGKERKLGYIATFSESNPRRRHYIQSGATPTVDLGIAGQVGRKRRIKKILAYKIKGYQPT